MWLVSLFHAGGHGLSSLVRVLALKRKMPLEIQDYDKAGQVCVSVFVHVCLFVSQYLSMLYNAARVHHAVSLLHQEHYTNLKVSCSIGMTKIQSFKQFLCVYDCCNFLPYLFLPLCAKTSL